MTAKDVLNISFPANFGCDEDTEVTTAIERVYDQLDKNVETAFGVSKFVIFLNNDEVAKIPFNGSFWYDSNEEDGYRFDEFNNSDYCATEAAVYADAVALGVEKFFASTKYYGKTAEGTPVYISERVYSLYEDDNIRSKITSSEASNKKATEIKTDYSVHISSTEWLAKAIEFYGADAVINLIDFIELEHINDFHSGNIGFRKDGSPVLLDYSGYDEF